MKIHNRTTLEDANLLERVACKLQGIVLNKTDCSWHDKILLILNTKLRRILSVINDLRKSC